jgi:fatty-acyl-CoA synthase
VRLRIIFTGCHKLKLLRLPVFQVKNMGEAVSAFVKLKAGQKITEEEIVDFCRGNIARFKIPKYIFFVNEFPMTASGKIQKYKLSQLAVQLCTEKGIDIE